MALSWWRWRRKWWWWWCTCSVSINIYFTFFLKNCFQWRKSNQAFCSSSANSFHSAIFRRNWMNAAAAAEVVDLIHFVHCSSDSLISVPLECFAVFSMKISSCEIWYERLTRVILGWKLSLFHFYDFILNFAESFFVLYTIRKRKSVLLFFQFWFFLVFRSLKRKVRKERLDLS